MLRSTTAIRSRFQCSANCVMAWSIFAWFVLTPRTSASAKTRVSSSTGWRAQNSSSCGAGSSSLLRSSWYRNWSATSRALRRLPAERRLDGLSASDMTRTRGTPPRSMVAELAEPFSHLQGGFRGLLAAVADVSARARPRLLFCQRRDDAERGGHTRRERDVANPGRRLARDVLEVRGLSPDHDADADDAGVASRRREVVRGLRQLEGAGHPVHLDRVGTEPGGAQRLQRARYQPLRDALVETGRDDREPERGRAPGGPAILRGATGHISLAATTGGARACRASC